ncbi:Crp/Fnr family transcriptional regulator [Paenibacillus thailandensis]|uniref:Crp/Fnr family transcriptional regulator n=1 Tax=Paenibacillus thailandensis TaxID=393250 RepID=A0ABW5QU53_9BACL
MQLIADTEMLHRLIDEYGLGVMLNGLEGEEIKLFRFQKGDFICRGGEPIDRLYVLVQGRLRVFRTLSNGKSLLLRFCNPPAMIGDLEFVTGRQAGSFVEAVTGGQVIAIDYEVLRAKHGRNPDFLQFLLRHLAHKLDTVSHSTSVNRLFPLEQRFANYLMSSQAAASSEFHASNLQHVAELLGTSYRHLNRIIAKFAAEGVVERKRGKIVIVDSEKLRARSSDDLYK